MLYNYGDFSKTHICKLKGRSWLRKVDRYVSLRFMFERDHIFHTYDLLPPEFDAEITQYNEARSTDN
jgi:hypothetical protein